MRTDEVAVVLAAMVAIAWVNWYFFIAARGPARDRVEQDHDRATRT
jgi:hypothetical protein